MIINDDAINYMKTLEDNSVDLIFTDPPYALGSEIIIKADGKPEYKKAVDFMNKWNQPNGVFWEEWFYEAKRVLKYGGHCLMFGMDRQLWFNCYYASKAGFTQKQSLYWYFISNFPKASDLSKNIDKYFGAEREVVGDNIRFGDKKSYAKNSSVDEGWSAMQTIGKITTPNTPLAKKYEGIKYSVAPLKQTNETIMVFQKPYKTGSCLHDVLAMENGDETITCGGVDIEGNRCGVSEEDYKQQIKKQESFVKSSQNKHSANGFDIQYETNPEERVNSNGRFPAQTYIDSGASEVIDRQSGVLKSDSITGVTACKMGETSTFGANNNQKLRRNDSGGASRILHKCDYDKDDHDIYFYCPKVSKSERQEGLTDIVCNHPTVKPTKLLTQILKLFKTPNDQIVLDPFMGSGSMGISAIRAGYEYVGVELDSEYYKIAEARIEHEKKKEKKMAELI